MLRTAERFSGNTLPPLNFCPKLKNFNNFGVCLPFPGSRVVIYSMEE